MRLKAVGAQARVELLMTLRRGENVVVTLVIPLGVLLFFGKVDTITNLHRVRRLRGILDRIEADLTNHSNELYQHGRGAPAAGPSRQRANASRSSAARVCRANAPRAAISKKVAPWRSARATASRNSSAPVRSPSARRMSPSWRRSDDDQ